MGILKFFFGGQAAVQQLPTGSVTVNRLGQIVTSTVVSNVPSSVLQSIARDVLELFREARTAQMPLAELSFHFGSLRITARELRGGAVIFLFPQTATSVVPTPTRQ